MSSYPRYALYYVPEEGSGLYRFGAQVLGYDTFTGSDVAFPPSILHAQEEWQSLTSDPRRYGFHATLKAPFSLRPGAAEADLLLELQKFVEWDRAIPVITPIVRTLGSFIAIVPSEPDAVLHDLARDCVVAFDQFREPLSSQDQVRRNPDALTPRQRDHLNRWGYPYVMEDFCFHMTLTGSLPLECRAAVATMLDQCFSALNVSALPIDRIALFKQKDGNSRFEVKTAYDVRARSRT